jgi:hypothetical protein
MSWFQKTPKLPEIQPIRTKTKFPSGLFVNVGEAIYYIKGDTKFKLYSYRVFSSWNAFAVLATPEALSGFKYGGTLGFRDGTLIHNIADGKMYLVSANKRRHIVSPDVFDKYGLDESRVLRVSEAEISLHEEGAELD